MLDIDRILAERDEVNEFVLEIKEGLGEDGINNDWSLTIKAPSHKQWQKWLLTYNKVNAQLAATYIGNESEDIDQKELSIPILMKLTDHQRELCDIGREIIALAKAWHGVKGEFSVQKALKYFESYPQQQLMIIVYVFLKNYETWLATLKKS